MVPIIRMIILIQWKIPVFMNFSNISYHFSQQMMKVIKNRTDGENILSIQFNTVEIYI